MSSRKRQKKNKLIFMDGRMDDVLDGLLKDIDFLMMTDMDDDEVGYTAPTAAAAIAPGSTPTPGSTPAPGSTPGSGSTPAPAPAPAPAPTPAPTPAPGPTEADKIIKLKSSVDPKVTDYINQLTTNYNSVILDVTSNPKKYKSVQQIGVLTIINSLIDLIEEGIVNNYTPTPPAPAPPAAPDTTLIVDSIIRYFKSILLSSLPSNSNLDLTLQNVFDSSNQ